MCGGRGSKESTTKLECRNVHGCVDASMCVSDEDEHNRCSALFGKAALALAAVVELQQPRFRARFGGSLSRPLSRLAPLPSGPSPSRPSPSRYVSRQWSPLLQGSPCSLPGARFPVLVSVAPVIRGGIYMWSVAAVRVQHCNAMPPHTCPCLTSRCGPDASSEKTRVDPAEPARLHKAVRGLQPRLNRIDREQCYIDRCASRPARLVG